MLPVLYNILLRHFIPSIDTWTFFQLINLEKGFIALNSSLLKLFSISPRKYCFLGKNSFLSLPKENLRYGIQSHGYICENRWVGGVATVSGIPAAACVHAVTGVPAVAVVPHAVLASLLFFNPPSVPSVPATAVVPAITDNPVVVGLSPWCQSWAQNRYFVNSYL